MAEVDANGDNVISYAEFNKAMTEVVAQRSSNLNNEIGSVSGR